MAKTFHAEILTPEKKIYDNDIISLIAPGATGYLGILADHAPLVAALAPGKITIREKSGRTIGFDTRSRGFIRVSRSKASLLTESVEPSK